jgi:tRNA (cytidine/uridine-2'-O-)-methyltransferase
LKKINIVLVEPEIPQNTGNISRTCACTDCSLHLVKPMKFSIEDRYLKRAGLDYWPYLDLKVHESLDEFLKFSEGSPLICASTKASNTYSDITYPDGCFILFGKETAGLPEPLLKKYYNNCIRIPMKDTLRSLNLSNSVAIIVYEALRQKNFEGLKKAGKLRNDDIL